MRKTFIFFSLFIAVLSACDNGSNPSLSPEKLEVSSFNRLRIRQRETIEIKGTAEDLSLYLGDITHGTCAVEIAGSVDKKNYLYLDCSLREHDSATFVYHDRYYRVIIDGFELHFIHDDFAFMTIREVPADQVDDNSKRMAKKRLAEPLLSPEQALEYLEQINKSKCTFIRDGYSKNGHDFFGFLAAKYAMHDKDIRTKSDFQRYILTRSDETGEPYRVVTEKGDTLLLEDWLNW